jgi:hypothetical protein
MASLFPCPFANPVAGAYLHSMTSSSSMTGSDRLLAGLPAEADRARPYPVERWHPPHCGHSQMAIDSEGRWFHEGGEIKRPELVRLFARLLRREPSGQHVLVTPVEMLDIDVTDAPLIATDMASEGSGRERVLRFQIGATGDWIIADETHRLVIESGEQGPRPYLTLDVGLRARLNRPVYYALADLALAEESDPAGIWSAGSFFPLEDAA